jgi:hypothetical protein
MSDNNIVPQHHLADYLQPGTRVWFRLSQRNEKGDMVDKLFGDSGDITYQGYTTVANSVYLVFDRVMGAGRKAKTESFAINAAHCPYIGPYTGQ